MFVYLFFNPCCAKPLNPPLIQVRKDRNISGYSRWTKAVKIKYNNICDNCNEADKKIVAHHLESFVSNQELRTDIENGVCLCVDCHTDFHEIFGMGHNTKEQYIEFKELNIPKIIEETKEIPIVQLNIRCTKMTIHNSISDAINKNKRLRYKHILWCCIDKWQMAGCDWWQFYNNDDIDILIKLKNRLKNQNKSIHPTSRPNDSNI